MNLSVSGTIAYDDASQTYQAIMGSNAGFKGTAVGRIKRRQDHLRPGARRRRTGPATP